MKINTDLVDQVKDFLDSGNREFLKTLKTLDRNDIQGQSIIRYLMQLKHWPFTPDSEFAEAIQFFFGEYPDRIRVPAEQYRAITADLIKEAWGYECVEIVPEIRPEPEPRTKTKASPKKSRKSETIPNEEGESGSRTFKSIAQANNE